ncbi:hypothetical protein T265_05473 [Opisthorchis viverrini]|uniref:Uncharacterized protein n=1 Tax=Opisthorchis viverrini TaxID=6198 RepID=A0A075AFA2_OPIVI|nr:hypothetical protein T265_05473 [Opisthorchis viverrini]KER27514.1 hypothetical protein T265_05473 [Opisthorchis viverrini]
MTKRTNRDYTPYKVAENSPTVHDQFRPFWSSSGRRSLELTQLPRYVKRSTTSSTSPWIVSGVFSDYTSTSMTLHFVDAKCIRKDGMTLVSSSKNTCAFSPLRT